MRDQDLVRPTPSRRHFQYLPSSTGGRDISIRDSLLRKAVIRGKEWAKGLWEGEGVSPADLAPEADVTMPDLPSLIRYAFLAPDIAEVIRAGAQPARITAESRRADRS